MPRVSSGRTARLLKKKEAAVTDGPKNLLVLRGPSASADVLAALRNFAALKKPHVKLLSRTNDVRPFDDVSSLEFLGDKNACQAFVYASHNKKRPHNLIFGRFFDGHVLDMVELGLSNFVGLEEIPGPKKRIGSIPCFLFIGDEWDRNPTCGRLRSLVLDIFGGRDMTGIALQGIDHVISLALVGERILWRTYSVAFMASDSKVPRVELSPMGPSLDLTVRRQHVPSLDLDKLAHKAPAAVKSQAPGARGKNVEKDELGETVGRIHMQRQDFGKLHLSKSRALKADLRGGGLRGGAVGAGEGDGDVADDAGLVDDGPARASAAVSAPEPAAPPHAGPPAAAATSGGKRRRHE